MNLKTALKILFGIIVIALTWVYIIQPELKLRKDYANLIIEHKTTLITNATLEKNNEGQYSKIIDNTKTITQLKKENTFLKNQDPIIIEKIVLQPVDTTTVPENVTITDTTVEITDYYPNKDNWFVKYKSNVDLQNKENTLGNFLFQPLLLNIVVTEEEHGIFKAHLKTADFIKVSVLDVDMLPLTPTDKIGVKNFGILLGGGYEKNLNYNPIDLTSKKYSIKVNVGFRYKKINIFGSIDTKEYIGINTLIEL